MLVVATGQLWRRAHSSKPVLWNRSVRGDPRCDGGGSAPPLARHTLPPSLSSCSFTPGTCHHSRHGGFHWTVYSQYLCGHRPSPNYLTTRVATPNKALNPSLACPAQNGESSSTLMWNSGTIYSRIWATSLFPFSVFRDGISHGINTREIPW